MSGTGSDVSFAANDADSLEFYVGDRTLNYPGTIWFALH